MSDKIEIKSPALHINGVEISALEMKPISFETFVAATVSAQESAKTQHDVSRNIWRERIKKQVVATGKDGKQHTFTDQSYGAIPGVYAIKLRSLMAKMDEQSAGEAGKIISEGDGIHTAILFQLSSPIKLSADKSVTELEIQLETMSALEDLFVMDNKMLQALEVLKKAKPIGEGVTLLTLPSAAIARIGIRDGLAVANDVVSRILGEETE